MLADLYATASLTELVVRLERAWASVVPRWRKAADRLLETTGLGLSLSGAGISATFQRQPCTDPLPALHALLDLSVRLRRSSNEAVTPSSGSDRRVAVIFDEFQSVGDLGGAEGLLRSHLQHHRDHTGYVFAGSETHLLDRQFGDPDRPFYGQATGRRCVCAWTGRRAARCGRPFRASSHDRAPGRRGSRPAAGLRRRPSTARDAARALPVALHPLRARRGPGHMGEARAQGRAHVAGEVEARYDRSTRNQQRVLRAVAHDLSPFTVAAQAPLGLDSGSVTKTVEQALRDALLEQRVDQVSGQPQAGGYRLIDPFLGDWIRRRFPL